MAKTVGKNSRGGIAKVGKNPSSQLANRSGVTSGTKPNPSVSSQLDAIKQKALGMQADLKAGNVTGLTPSTPATPASTPVPSTPSAPTYTPYTPTTTNADSSYKALMDSMQMTPQEKALQDQQTALDSELRNLNQGQGVMNQNLKDQPIALPFITGQMSAVENRYALQRGDVTNRQQTLQQKLANLQQQRQAAIDVAKVGVDYGTSKDSQINQANQYNATQGLAYNKYTNDLTQQQYENKTQADQFRQKLAIDQQNANRLSAEASKSTNDEDKQIQSFQKDAGAYVEKLGNGEVSWATAFNALKAMYPQASNELIDQTLNKERYYSVK